VEFIIVYINMIIKQRSDMKKIYVAGPISDVKTSNVYRNLREGVKVSARLLKLGFIPFCPFLDMPFNYFEDLNDDEIYNYGLAWIEDCDALLCFDKGWQRSIGTRLEIMRAIDLQVPVFFDIETMQAFFDSPRPGEIYNQDKAVDIAHYIEELFAKDKSKTKVCDKPEKQLSSFEQIGNEIGKLVTEKNKAYGNAFEKSCDILKVLYPDGIPVDKLQDALTIVRIIDKLMRIATDKDAFGEDPFRDIAGYSILAVEKRLRDKA
jgi:hypothetical protein